MVAAFDVGGTMCTVRGLEYKEVGADVMWYGPDTTPCELLLVHNPNKANADGYKN